MRQRQKRERGRGRQAWRRRAALPSFFSLPAPRAPPVSHPFHPLSLSVSLSIPSQAHADLGFLMSPGNGAVSALAFYTPPGAGAPSHLLSGTADGGIAVWTAGGEWDCLKTMGDHT